MEPIILVENLVRRFGEVTAVNHLSLSIRPGEIYGLVGPDGAGKTTTFRLLVGALRPDAGRGVIAGHDLLADIDRAREQIGYLPQRFSLYGDLTVAENLRFFAEVNGIPAAEWRPRRDQMLDFVGLAEFAGRRAAQLSGGMKQKLGLATALIHRPRLLLLDEPTGGVDPVTRQDFWQLIGRIVVEEGVTVVISTPYMDEAARCSRVGFLSGGRLLTEGTPQQVAGRLNGRILELVGGPRQVLRRVATADLDVEEAHTFGSKLHLRLRPGAAEAVLARLPEQLAAAGATVERLRPIAPSLEDAFIELLTRE
ncbi:MAG: ABC transporter ATP-binding protein [Chloroflexi bacterium]|nr:ABC transporter ATP-binding protein [Chloroflexota bacterium]MCI0578134.1 ABC transporter ATP-binding protein [Chloroflexota bacterium]MCI0649626.1 ABC transporter ATP-binding protein [Chloroflexota bacterium]MCI0727913.1 ABC transporter ATP-binding protein [Chloroflexota bacterium]